NRTQRSVWFAIRRRLHGSGVAATVTSGTRDTRRQASAMLEKVRLYGLDALDIYDPRVKPALAMLPRTVDAWAVGLTALINAGVRISRHADGRAIDLRIRDLSGPQRVKLQAAADAVVKPLRGRTLMEQDHLHVQW
ncbi:MAG: hypothetical protein RI826_09935, partial [Chlorobium phaeovibrioides]|nr:hypothetical protein [Chlorobium phaeovibrioides]